MYVAGLGLSIVQETIESLGGRVWTEFPDEGGSIFGFSLPSRRDEDAAAAGTRRDTANVRDPAQIVPGADATSIPA